MKKIILVFLFSICTLYSQRGDHCCVISIPKSGTHLLIKAVALITHKNVGFFNKEANFNKLERSSYFLWGHLVYNEHILRIFNAQQIKGLYIIRDPRDQIGSFARENWRNRPNIHKEYKDFDDFLLRLIFETGPTIFSWSNGDLFHLQYKNIVGWYRLYLEWKKSHFVYTTRFEKLVGPMGGGTLADQYVEIKNIALHIGVSLTDAEVVIISNNLFGETPTFREGQICKWRQFFKSKHKKAFKAIAGQLLIDLEYEKDFNW